MGDKQFYMETLKSNECQCGRTKRKRMSFCYRCYYKLPTDMRGALYRQMGDGYEEAYDAAEKYLQEY